MYSETLTVKSHGGHGVIIKLYSIFFTLRIYSKIGFDRILNVLN